MLFRFNYCSFYDNTKDIGFYSYAAIDGDPKATFNHCVLSKSYITKIFYDRGPFTISMTSTLENMLLYMNPNNFKTQGYNNSHGVHAGPNKWADSVKYLEVEQ